MTNANKARPAVVLELDKPRTLIFDLNALCKAEDALGKSFFRLVNWTDLGVRDLRLLLWVGLLSDDPDLTQEQVGTLFHSHNLGAQIRDIQSLIETALDAAMPYLGEDDIKAIEDQKKKVAKGARGMKEAMKETSTGLKSIA